MFLNQSFVYTAWTTKRVSDPIPNISRPRTRVLKEYKSAPKLMMNYPIKTSIVVMIKHGPFPHLSISFPPIMGIIIFGNE